MIFVILGVLFWIFAIILIVRHPGFAGIPCEPAGHPYQPIPRASFGRLGPFPPRMICV
jgi:hypothetical protein